MKAIATRRALKILIWQDKANTDIEAEKVDEEMEELERLAEIGKAVEAATERGLIWVEANDCTTSQNDIACLLNWYRTECD